MIASPGLCELARPIGQLESSIPTALNRNVLCSVVTSVCKAHWFLVVVDMSGSLLVILFGFCLCACEPVPAVRMCVPCRTARCTAARCGRARPAFTRVPAAWLGPRGGDFVVFHPGPSESLGSVCSAGSTKPHAFSVCTFPYHQFFGHSGLLIVDPIHC